MKTMTAQEALEIIDDMRDTLFARMDPRLFPMAYDHALATLKSAVGERDALKTDLERARPLIEAVEADGTFCVTGETSPVAHRVIQAILAYRQAKEKP